MAVPFALKTLLAFNQEVGIIARVYQTDCSDGSHFVRERFRRETLPSHGFSVSAPREAKSFLVCDYHKPILLQRTMMRLSDFLLFVKK
jgi:hypothetical protein